MAYKKVTKTLADEVSLILAKKKFDQKISGKEKEKSKKLDSFFRN